MDLGAWFLLSWACFASFLVIVLLGQLMGNQNKKHEVLKELVGANFKLATVLHDASADLQDELSEDRLGISDEAA